MYFLAPKVILDEIVPQGSFSCSNASLASAGIQSGVEETRDIVHPPSIRLLEHEHVLRAERLGHRGFGVAFPKANGEETGRF